MAKRILMLGNSSLVIFGMRGELVQRLLDEGYDVIVSVPNNAFGEGKKQAEKFGCPVIEIPIDRRGTSVFQDALLLLNYIKLMRKVRPDAVLTYTVKCTIYGGIACRLLRIPYIVNITGLGKGLAEDGIQQKLLISLYKIAVKNAECVFFQNKMDRQFFNNHGIRYKKDDVLPGSGVNLEKYIPLPYPSDEKIVFTYIARIMKTKGIDEFLEAARVIRTKNSKVEFHICGYYEEDYKEIIESAHQAGIIEYHGMVEDVRAYEAISHCIVLPSYHPEGVSNVLLEAAACARPIITTNRPGCGDVLDDGVNGFAVREKDSQNLIQTMRRFMALSWEERMNMGLAGRAKVEKEYDRQIVVKKYMEVLKKS